MPVFRLSSTPNDLPPPSAMTVSAPRTHDDGGFLSHFDGSHPPGGYGHNVFLPCPYCDKQNNLANKCWKQFGKPPTAQAVLTLLTPFP